MGLQRPGPETIALLAPTVNAAEERIADVERRVLLVGGEKDPIAPPEWLHALASRCRSPEVAVLADQPHVMMYTRPEAVARILLERA
ncbi:alpha/beta hydrolase [Sinomonas albida]|uniref:alpha/beta fold hydrolase n=1 Tax=Sinomonas albida TaxID=369942 RepID=UPI003016E8F0